MFSHMVNCMNEGNLPSSEVDRNFRPTSILGIPVSKINAKSGDCPQPIGISGYPDQSSTGCWLDTNCPGVQKCCLEPNPAAHNAQRICRDPIGISSRFLF